MRSLKMHGKVNEPNDTVTIGPRERPCLQTNGKPGVRRCAKPSCSHTGKTITSKNHWDAGQQLKMMNGYGGLMPLKMPHMKNSPIEPTGNGLDPTPIKLPVDTTLNMRWM